MNDKKGRLAETAYVLGIILCPLGICLTAKSGFGVSMVVAPAYVVFQKLSQIFPWFTFGKSEYFLQGLLLILLALVVRRFKWKYLLSFITAFLYGSVLDAWFSVLGLAQYTIMWQRVGACVLGLLITALSIAFFLRTYLPQAAYEMFVKDVSDHFHFSMTKVKWIFDISALLSAIILMLTLLNEFAFNIIGINTVITTFVNAPLIGFFGKLLDKRYSFESAYPEFHAKFQKLMN